MNYNILERLRPVICTVLIADFKLWDGSTKSRAESNLRYDKYPGKLQDNSGKSIWLTAFSKKNLA